eukprot:353510-Chlamydomonas_euryale.AAC.4
MDRRAAWRKAHGPMCCMVHSAWAVTLHGARRMGRCAEWCIAHGKARCMAQGAWPDVLHGTEAWCCSVNNTPEHTREFRGEGMRRAILDRLPHCPLQSHRCVVDNTTRLSKREGAKDAQCVLPQCGIKSCSATLLLAIMKGRAHTLYGAPCMSESATWPMPPTLEQSKGGERGMLVQPPLCMVESSSTDDQCLGH